MQFRELSLDEIVDNFETISLHYIDLDIDNFREFLEKNHPSSYRAIGAFERGELLIYAGVSIRENLSYGLFIEVEEFISQNRLHTKEMLDFINDYAKLYGCKKILLNTPAIGLNIDDLADYTPARGIFMSEPI